ncbi:DBF4-type zinc finger-containing protein 2 isoform X2 [Dasypus novemcinctus]|uniref:DBF4-type zinc finger-containing protein 2 isoform X2 n=1 Tax=Dasypus novemcinctus TaxID=9361 RepID=UPI0039C9676D
MQNRQGYCTYCRVYYNNLEKHMFSTQHRNLATQSRHQMGTSSLMERFLQDVLRHHPYQYQENRSAHNERLLMNPVSPSEVAHFDDFIPEEMAEDTAGFTVEKPTKSLEPVEELCSRPRKSQEYTQNVLIRPSVIKKLEKGQQQPLEFVHKIGSHIKEFNLIDVGQASNNGQNLVSCSVISSVPTGHLSESCYDRPVMNNITRLPLAAHLGSVGKCDPKKVNRALDQVGKGSSNTVSSPHLESSSISYQKSKESNRKSLGIKSGKLVLQKDIKSQGKTLSTGFKFHEIMGNEGSFRFKSLSKLPVNSAVILNKTDKFSNKGILEDDIPKYHEELFSTTDCTQQEKHLIFSRSAFLEQNCSKSSDMKFDCGSLQSVSGQPQETVQELNLWKEEQIDQEDKNCESRGSEMSFDYSSSFHPLTDQSKVTAKELNFSKEIYDDLQCKNNKSCVSEISSDCDSSLQLVTNQSQVTAKEISLQKAIHISLVDKRYESSSSEINFDCDTPLQSVIDHPQPPVKEVNLPKEVHTDLIDKNYESSCSKISTDSAFPFQTMVDLLPVAVKEIKLRKKLHIDLVDKNCGSSCSETSFDCGISHQSVVDHPQLAVKERNLKDRHVNQKDKKYKLNGTKGCLDCDICLQIVTDEPQRTVEEINLPKENIDLVNKSCESHGLEMHFHTVAQLVADQSQVAVKDVNLREVNIDLENKSDESSIFDLSFDSHASLHHSANHLPQGVWGETNLKEFSVDMEVKSYACSSSVLTFDSDPPLLSVTEQSQLAFDEIKKEHINLEDRSCESDSSDITFDSDIPLQSVVDQPQVTVDGKEHIDLENKIDQPEVAVKQIHLEKEDHAYLEDKNSQYSVSEMSLDSDFLFQLIVDQHQITILEQEHIELEDKQNQSCGSEVSFDSDDSLQSVADQLKLLKK